MQDPKELRDCARRISRSHEREEKEQAELMTRTADAIDGGYQIHCSDCHGAGSYVATSVGTVKCKRCDGTGKLPPVRTRPKPVALSLRAKAEYDAFDGARLLMLADAVDAGKVTPCRTCSGSGKHPLGVAEPKLCSDCLGVGWVQRQGSEDSP